MVVDVDALHSRLASVNHRLVPTSQITAALRQGTSANQSAPSDFFIQVINLSRANPILGTAFALGAYQSSTSSHNAIEIHHAYTALGIALCRWGYFAEALPFLSETSAAKNKQPHSIDLLAEWHAILCTRRIRSFPDASDQLIEIAARLEEAGNLRAAMQCRQDVVSMHHLPSRDGEIEQVLSAAQDYFETHAMIGDLGICLVTKVFASLHQADFEGALEILDEAERLFVKARMPTLISYAWQVRGHIYLLQRRMKDAKYWTRRARLYAARTNHEYYLSLCLFTQFNIFYETGDLLTCRRILDALEVLSSAQELIHVRADTAIIAGNFALRLGRYDEAEANYTRAERVYVDADLPVGVALCQMSLGIVARRKGNFGRSLRLLEQSRAALVRTQNFVMGALAHHNLAKTYAAFGYFEPAIEHAQQGIQLLRDHQADRMAVKPAIYLARLLAERNQLGEAYRLLDSASHLAAQADLTEDCANVELVRALALRRTGQHGEALAAYQRSLNLLAPLGHREGVWEAWLGLAETQDELGNIRQAGISLHRLRRSRLPAHLRWRYDWIAAKIAVRRHRPATALAAYRYALAQARDSRRSLEQEEQIEPFALALQPLYEEAFALALSNDQPILALAFTEMHSSQLLSVRLGRAIGLTDDPHDIPARLSDRLRARGGRDWTVLRYAWSRDAVWLFALTPEGVGTYHISLDEALAALLVCASPDDSHREFVYRGRSRTQRNALEQGREARRLLFETLIPEPIQNRLSPEHLLVIVPASKLHGLPFHALLDGKEPLIQRARVIYAHSLTSLCESLEAHVDIASGLGRGLICGQSRFAHPQYGPLPYVVDEIDAISAAASVAPDCLVNNQLTGSALLELAHSGRLASYDWLHFSTHAYYDAATGAFTGLLLGQDTIEISDILTWQIRARLVTLSACQTGVGKWYYGDEIAGLVQALLGAGAQTVVASLWPTREQHIPELMADFYGGMAQGHPPSTALAWAQRAAHHNDVDPYDWASWTVFGHS